MLFAPLGASTAALHPAFSEIVPTISFRQETLTSLFGLTPFLTHESGIAVITLLVGYDAFQCVASVDWREEMRRRLPSYAPTLQVIPGYFALRWFAFGNPIGDPNAGVTSCCRLRRSGGCARSLPRTSQATPG